MSILPYKNLGDIMAANPHIQEKIYRLETLKKTQAYYGPHTPYQIVVEINQLEAELRRMLRADLTRPAKPSRRKPAGAAKPAPAAKAVQPLKKVAKPAVKKPPQKKPFWYLSKSTRELIGIMAFIGLVFLFSSIIFAAYAQSRNNREGGWSQAIALEPTLRPTFTPTLEPGAAAPAEVQTVGDTLTAPSADVHLPSAEKEPTAIPTLVPTLTPSAAPSATPIPPPTETPVPPPPPRPAPAQPQQAAAVPAAAPAAPAAAPTEPPPAAPSSPGFPFVLSEQGNREFQKTNYHGITIYVAIVSEGNIPIGGMKVVGDHSSGLHTESALSDWFWSVTNCLDCDYVKFGNVKFEPGTFSDGVWSIYVADAQGNPLSAAVPLPYSSDPNQWVWDFVIFKKVGG
jgi:hypothetical protein